MKFSCVKMAEEVASGKSKTASKAKNTFSDEETENMISLWSEEEVLFLLLQIIETMTAAETSGIARDFGMSQVKMSCACKLS